MAKYDARTKNIIHGEGYRETVFPITINSFTSKSLCGRYIFIRFTLIRFVTEFNKIDKITCEHIDDFE